MSFTPVPPSSTFTTPSFSTSMTKPDPPLPPPPPPPPPSSSSSMCVDSVDVVMVGSPVQPPTTPTAPMTQGGGGGGAGGPPPPPPSSTYPSSHGHGHGYDEPNVYRQALMCSACQIRFKDTCILRCMHTFCRTCIQARLDKRQRKCPTCAESFGANDVKTIYL
ncbi:E3 ubiquitin-protein ligase bre1 [Coelomomyces lativittatus]|nr:E3 ubiquitin-protein ligase bre1 [Coelomomyces lativittatus]